MSTCQLDLPISELIFDEHQYCGRCYHTKMGKITRILGVLADRKLTAHSKGWIDAFVPFWKPKHEARCDGCGHVAKNGKYKVVFKEETCFECGFPESQGHNDYCEEGWRLGK